MGIIGCQKQAAGPPPRYAIVRFENLSGDPALDWTGRAASEVLTTSLTGAMEGSVLSPVALARTSATLGVRPASAPGLSTSRAAALLAGATRLISGYVVRHGDRVRVVATEEDIAEGKARQTLSAEDGSAIGALQQLSRGFSQTARPYPTTNAAALQLYAEGIEAQPSEAATKLELAVKADPDFGPAWLALVGIKGAQGDRSETASVIATARGRKLDKVSAANLELEAATLQGDTRARVAAMRGVSDVSPTDAFLLRSLAEAETATGDFTAAARDWKKLTALMPEDPAAWNSLGYARSYAGDYAGALAALEEYRRLRPADANPLDSIGDLDYSFRKFGDAAASYLEADAKQPGFQQHGGLYKAAWAKFSAGDSKGADTLFARFREAREKAADPLLPIKVADWLYRTGRPREGMDALRKTAQGAGAGPLRANAYTQLAIWDLLGGDRERAIADASASGPPATVPQLVVRFVCQPSATAEEWALRAQRTMPLPTMNGVRQLALGYALLLDGKRQAALPAWEQIVGTSPATDFFSRAVYTHLQGKETARPVLPDPAALNEFAAVLAMASK